VAPSTQAKDALFDGVVRIYMFLNAVHGPTFVDRACPRLEKTLRTVTPTGGVWTPDAKAVVRAHCTDLILGARNNNECEALRVAAVMALVSADVYGDVQGAQPKFLLCGRCGRATPPEKPQCTDCDRARDESKEQAR